MAKKWLCSKSWYFNGFNPLSPELNRICYLLELLANHFLHVSRIRVKSLTLKLLMSYIYGAPTLDVSRSHTTTQHSR
jgi:transposase